MASRPVHGVSNSCRAHCPVIASVKFRTRPTHVYTHVSRHGLSVRAELVPAAARSCTTLAARSKHVALGFVLSGFLAGAAHAMDPAESFQRTGCVGCHAGGGNVVQAGASLQTKDLEKNGAATVDAIYKLIYSGKGKMPGYGKECQPRGKCTFGPRLADDDIQRLSQYVLDQAAVQWKQ